MHEQRRRIAREVPWGYTINRDNPRLLDPIEELLDTLDKAKDLCNKGVSLRDAAKWLYAVTGVYLSHVGLGKQIKKENKAKKRAAALLGLERTKALGDKEFGDGATGHPPAST